jgi:hypothetical protein
MPSDSCRPSGASVYYKCRAIGLSFGGYVLHRKGSPVRRNPNFRSLRLVAIVTPSGFGGIHGSEFRPGRHLPRHP